MDENTLQKVNRILELLQNDTITPKELESFLQVIVKALNETKKEIDSVSEKNNSAIKDALQGVQAAGQKILSEVDSKNEAFLRDFAKKMSKLDSAIAEVMAIEVKDVEDGAPGKDADEEAVIAAVLKKIPNPEIDGNSIIEKINGSEDKIDASRIKGLDAVMQPSRPIFGGGKTKIVRVDLSDQLDGNLKTFFLGTHFGIISVDSSSAPFGSFREGVDYNESGKSIVFTSNVDAAVSLASGQNLIIKVLR